MKIIMIYSNKCPKCKLMKKKINSVIKSINTNVELITYDCEDDESIEVALEYGISDVPGCNIEGTVIEGEDFNPDDLVKTLKKLSK